DRRLYWTDGKDVWSAPLSDPTQPPVLVVQDAGVLRLAVSDRYLAWIKAGSVSAMDLRSGAPAFTVASTGADNPGDLALDSTYVYWTNTWTNGAGVCDPGVDGCQCTNAGAVWRAERTGSSPLEIAFLQPCPKDLAVSGAGP